MDWAAIGWLKIKEIQERVSAFSSTNLVFAQQQTLPSQSAGHGDEASIWGTSDITLTSSCAYPADSYPMGSGHWP